jgi:hypothetical protein
LAHGLLEAGTAVGLWIVVEDPNQQRRGRHGAGR